MRRGNFFKSEFFVSAFQITTLFCAKNFFEFFAGYPKIVELFAFVDKIFKLIYVKDYFEGFTFGLSNPKKSRLPISRF